MTSSARRVAILGGAGGIGRKLVEQLHAQGDDVCVLDLATSLERHRLDVPSIPLDLLSENSVKAAAAELSRMWDRVDGFVNLAGYNSHLFPLAETETDYFDDVIAGNLRGAFLATKAFLPLLGGDAPSFVNVSSGLASFVRPGYGSYSAAKAGVIAMTKTLALEWAPKVRVNAVAPGLVDTAFLRGGTGRSNEDAPVIVNVEPYLAAIPLKRLAQPEDVVGPILFLLGRSSSYMTGQVLWINGGAYMP
jgi:NAD(P)-dependent dehydrogenase (short-subunit alcohol dehydrogenase family)